MNGKCSVGSHLWLPVLLVLCLMACMRVGYAQVAPPFTTLHSFNGNDGIMFEPQIPWSGYSVLGPGLIQGKDGNLYGTTPYGGPLSDSGTVFKITTSGVFTSLYSFSGRDGFEPNALIQGKDGALYGTTVEGGANPHQWVIQGTVFKMTLSGALTTLYDFSVKPAGFWPYTGLVQARDGTLYGTTSFGGQDPGNTGDGIGTLFKIRPNGSGFATIYSFAGGADGNYPWAALIQGHDGALYGTTYGYVFNETSGAYGGSVFKITESGALTVLHDFGSNDGTWPYGALVQGKDGAFYGTTQSGGANNNGTVFKITPAGVMTTLYSFSNTGTDGANPSAGLIWGKDGALYGTATYGGATGYGTVFRITTSGVLTTLYSFSDDSGASDNTDGADPIAPLLQGKDGNLYGTASYGGPDDDGTAFKLTMTPVISSFNPAKGPAGTSITVKGSNFTEAINVQFGNIYVAFKVNSDTSLTFTVPKGAPSARITVTNPFGKGVSKTAFKVTP